VHNEDRIAREAIAGPVPYGDAEESVVVANDSEYGLRGTV